jgi:hypothetical protein
MEQMPENDYTSFMVWINKILLFRNVPTAPKWLPSSFNSNMLVKDTDLQTVINPQLIHRLKIINVKFIFIQGNATADVPEYR